jgi:hypothetical protein
MDGLVPPVEVTAFLTRLHVEIDAHVVELEAFMAQHRAVLPPAARLALESGIHDARGRSAWLTRARRQSSASRPRLTAMRPAPRSQGRGSKAGRARG